MATITPTRFGLKYGPVPTLALEYEEDLGVVENDDGTRSLYVFKESSELGSRDRRVRKKLHVVELPQLHGRSEPLAVVRQLQQNNHRFLGPSVVKEQQLQRLLQQLVDHLPGATGDSAVRNDARAVEVVEPVGTQAATRETGDDDDAQDEEPLEESVMEESVAEASMDASHAEDDDVEDTYHTKQNGEIASQHRTGKFITQTDSDGDEDAEKDGEDNPSAAPSPTPAVAKPDEDREEDEDDAKKKKALKSDSDASEEEDVQSEELEYFSEDGSDEDSF